jgi:hypothetical protein
MDIANYGNMYLLIGLSSLSAVVFMMAAYTSKTQLKDLNDSQLGRLFTRNFFAEIPH